MRKLEEQTGVVADPNYINGKLVGGTTKVSEGINQDIVQFFQKITESLTRNGLPDNEANGYQTLTGLIAYLRTNMQAVEERRGVAELATTEEAQAETDDTRIMTPKKVADSKKITYTDQDGVDTLVRLKKKVVEIGGWDMDAEISKTVTHGLTDSSIRGINVVIQNDAASQFWNLNTVNPSGDASGGSITYSSGGELILNRVTGGFFDSTAYDDDTINRGWVTIEYQV